MTGRSLLAVALAVATTACAQPLPEASPTPLPELAVAPDVLEATPPGAGAPDRERPAPGSSPTPAPPTPVPTDAGGSEAPPATEDPTGAPSAEGTEGPTSSSFRSILALEDASGDEGLEAPTYADLRAVTMQDDGERLRVWVDVGGDVPATLEDGEVIGMGVDLYLDGGDESDYQLFVDGGSDGWHAYFHTPRGFVAYPGTFAIGGRRFEFVIPWGSMGSPPEGQAEVFLDWSQARLLLNAAGSDRAPDRGAGPWAR